MSDLDTFGRILDGHRPGAHVTCDTIRDDLVAAQIHPAQYGALFRSACEREWITPTGYTKSTSGPRRGGINRVYRVAGRAAE